MIKFSFFVGGSKIVTPTTVYDFKDLINLYKSNYIKNLTSKLISCTDATDKMILKNQQPFITPYGTFGYRKNESILHHNSNLVAFDFDKMEQNKAKELKAVLSNNKSCMLATISGSQKGVKAFFLIDYTLPLNEHYNTLKYNADNLLNLLGASDFKTFLDLRQFVLSQPMFISYDAEIYYNFQAQALAVNLEMYKEPERIKNIFSSKILGISTTDEDLKLVINYVQKATENLCNFYGNHTGARHDTIAKVKSIAGLIKAYNLPIESEIYNALESSIVGMYGGSAEAKISNAYKSLKHAWENAEAIQIPTKKTAEIKALFLNSITSKSYLITESNGNKLNIPKSQVLGFTNNIFTVTEWYYNNRLK